MGKFEKALEHLYKRIDSKLQEFERGHRKGRIGCLKELR
jgi:hypothetical protein